MPQQELFFEHVAAGRKVEVLKTYDEQFAREVFNNMDDEAHAHLWSSLRPEQVYDPAGLPSPSEPEDYEAFLWDELVEQAREDWKTFSYFVVNETVNGRPESLYVSADWPSAEAFAKSRIVAVQ
jgi:hypothetical protein